MKPRTWPKRPEPFIGTYRCTSCGYRVRWRKSDREFFPATWEGACPHCTVVMRWEGE